MRLINLHINKIINIKRPANTGLSHFKTLRALVGVIILITIISGITFQLFGFNMLDIMPKHSFCPFRAITGKPCPGCGMTHAFIHISQFKFITAFKENPFSIPFYIVMILFLFTGNIPKMLKSNTFKYLFLFCVIILWIVRLNN